MARLAHPGIVRLHETGTTEEGIHYLVAEYVDGETLEARVARGRVPLEETLRIVTGVAEALAYAHEHGVIHRDVKPSNVIVDRDGPPAPHGLRARASATTRAPPRRATASSWGRPLTCRRSRRAGTRGSWTRAATSTASARSCTSCSRATVRSRATGGMLLLQVLEDEPRPPRRLDESIPRDLETICLTAMAKSRGAAVPDRGRPRR